MARPWPEHASILMVGSSLSLQLVLPPKTSGSRPIATAPILDGLSHISLAGSSTLRHLPHHHLYFLLGVRVLAFKGRASRIFIGASQVSVACFPPLVVGRGPTNPKAASRSKVVAAPSLAQEKTRHEQSIGRDNHCPSTFPKECHHIAP
ncbi:hypothetical protein B296_00009748 [Ensete ventricosum]|uniref:Uncharacterized protein n=1 Tax=Ensete ventricosum TaxID=4639 RepID=A0A427A8G7_ENSVE|nr:hypothetical protein B296_00009748 [Ensete ventricosum]